MWPAGTSAERGAVWGIKRAKSASGIHVASDLCSRQQMTGRKRALCLANFQWLKAIQVCRDQTRGRDCSRQAAAQAPRAARARRPNQTRVAEPPDFAHARLARRLADLGGHRWRRRRQLVARGRGASGSTAPAISPGETRLASFTVSAAATSRSSAAATGSSSARSSPRSARCRTSPSAPSSACRRTGLRACRSAARCQPCRPQADRRPAVRAAAGHCRPTCSRPAGS